MQHLTPQTTTSGTTTLRALTRPQTHLCTPCLQAIEQLTPLSESQPGHVEVAPLDLGCLRSVRDFADSFNERCRPLDLLICNAGIMVGVCLLRLKFCMEQ